ncbi:MAG: hypothetical protein ACLPKB_02555 [Xanthobacteraceae bacterium]
MDAFGALAGALLLLSPAGAIAAPKRLDCNLTDFETKAGPKSDSGTEKRSITVVFDEEAKGLTVYQYGSARVLNNVTISQTSMNGYVNDISLGIDPSSWNIVFQTYEPDTTRVEFGVCGLSAKPLP